MSFCLAGSCIFISNAAVLTYGNFTGSNPDSSETKATLGLNGGALAIGFVVNNPGYTLSSFSIDLSRSGNSRARFRVYRGSPGGTLLFTSPNTMLNTTATIQTFSGLNVSLSSGQTYWLVIDANQQNGSTRVHSATGNQLPTGTANLSMVGYRVYTTEALTSHTGTVTTDFPNFSVTVPEPHEYALVAAISLSLFAVYRRRSLTA